jgi:uncharacterized protein
MKNIFSLLTIILFAHDGFALEFKKTKMILGKTIINVEVADNNERRERGLMNRSSLKDSEGMIFIFPDARPQGFWMKNTLIPLSIGFFDDKGKLFQILDMEPASPVEVYPRTYTSAKPARFALEEPKGWFARKNISVGEQLHLPERSELKELLK